MVPGLVARAERERVRFLTPVSSTGVYSPPPIAPLGSSNFPVVFQKPTSTNPAIKKPLFTSVPYFPYYIPNLD